MSDLVHYLPGARDAQESIVRVASVANTYERPVLVVSDKHAVATSRPMFNNLLGGGVRHNSTSRLPVLTKAGGDFFTIQASSWCGSTWRLGFPLTNCTLHSNGSLVFIAYTPLFFSVVVILNALNLLV